MRAKSGGSKSGVSMRLWTITVFSGFEVEFEEDDDADEDPAIEQDAQFWGSGVKRWT